MPALQLIFPVANQEDKKKERVLKLKSLYVDNRTSQILQCFHKTPVITVSTLAARFQVSERTIRNDIKQLNQELGGIASIEGKKGSMVCIYFRLKRSMSFLPSCLKQTHF